MILGIDIGGANTKLASSDGSHTEIHYLPLWKSSLLPEVLKDIASRHKPEAVGVVMTGELADSFSDKDEGIQYIARAVEEAFADVWYIDSSGTPAREAKRSAAAANWAASAVLAGRDFGDCIFADTGSTTTDIIPVVNGAAACAKTDLERLCRGELIYAGALRTNLAALMDRVELRGCACRISSELFAITGDVYLLLGHISAEAYNCETPDGSGKDTGSARRRLARVVCADIHELSDEDLISIAEQAKQKQVSELAGALSGCAGKWKLERVVGCGLGEFLIEEACAKAGLGFTSVSQEYGHDISVVFPAYAAARIVSEKCF
ncbi:MAG TPA: H4MPT-linked C1 transfer pathway protein [Candidatus Methanoperedenaceae archaeon]|nr:H4MPT-linked C1 transfer pathway protein [Candidatus Methanoperedenaceae archaeon]